MRRHCSRLLMLLSITLGTLFMLQMHHHFTETSAPKKIHMTPLVTTSPHCNKRKSNLNKPRVPAKTLKSIKNFRKEYSNNWKKNEENHNILRSRKDKSLYTVHNDPSLLHRSLLITKCNGFQKAVVTKENTSLKTIVFDGDRKVLKVKQKVFNSFVKDNPFLNKTLDTCSVVGNGGILMNSSCGEAIDSAQFVIRCNMAPLSNCYTAHVGRKTSLITANPSIIVKRYRSLLEHRRKFFEDVNIYGNALLFLPAFSFNKNTDFCLRALYTLEDFRSSVKAVFMNPEYLKRLDTFWRSNGLNPHNRLNPRNRLSSGFMMVSLALELCNNVDVYGFWPYNNHPYSLEALDNHYYDNVPPRKNGHAMPAEFAILLKLHRRGVLRLHLGECAPSTC